MKVKIDLTAGGELVKEAVIEIDDRKVEHLDEDQLRQAIEINIRSWADRTIGISWEITEGIEREDDLD
ncbi:hypothetical protein [Paenibacillus lutrae]|uniref:Uncharacterized protein n=1 Tax=Paenibacillus lutrae TaxID=2078573 RepID=A0A7X3FIA1_9BACL|nr:hypothetical protein [Paenibacillus lutrae]MVP00132.1 hypothetical protein [Paenibacillus lutrae]